MRRAYRESGLGGRVRFAFSECLGPCSEANVVLLSLNGRPLWLRLINSVETFIEVLDDAGKSADGAVEMPPSLVPRAFSWTGGGIGPPPPLRD